jgi:hypothetical protein
MKKIVATLIAGLFATAAFAQTPAPAAGQTTTPDSATSPAVAQAAAQHEKQAAKPAKHAKSKAKVHQAETKDTQKDPGSDAKAPSK